MKTKLIFTFALVAGFLSLLQLPARAQGYYHNGGYNSGGGVGIVISGNNGGDYHGPHRDWDRGREHYYNHNHYRWYNGSWVVINTTSRPVYRETGGSVGSAVQSRLAQQGYYHGPIDGDIGPGSRHAIASYQADQGMRVTGRIDSQLLASLRI